MKINNCIELWEAHGGWKVNMEDRAKQLLEKSVFKHTECGCSFTTDDRGVWVGGFAEGSDVELAGYPLRWGFTLEEWNTALEMADEDGVKEWHRANDLDLARVVDENYEDHKEKEWPDEYDIGGEG